MRQLLPCITSALLTAIGIAGIVFGQEEEPRPEVSLSDKEIGRLDIFEDRALSEADAAFDRTEYAVARPLYEAFAKRHPNSPALAYALLRKGRCADLGGQPAEAIADYQAVVARFPKLQKYAAPALFHQAQCHLAGGAQEEATKALSQLAENPDYRRSPLAAEAMRLLLKTAADQGSPAKVLEYYERTGLDWRRSDDEAVRKAIGEIIRQHVRTEPDEAKLRAFYKTLKKDPGEQLDESLAYWNWVAQCILDNASFTYYQREERQKYFDHWLGVLEGKFPDSDDFQIAIARLHYGADSDRTKLGERLDAQFKKHQKEGDWRRILKWVRANKGDWNKTREYVGMLDYKTVGIDGIGEAMDVLCNEQQESYLAKSAFGKFCEGVPYDELSNAEILKLISIAGEVVEDTTTARSLVEKLHFEKMPEQEKLALARKYLQINATIARQIYDQLEDKAAGKLELFEYYLEADETSQAIALAGELAEMEKYAREFSVKKAKLLEEAKRYSEAVTAYQQCGDAPVYLWRIAECYLAMERPDQAIEQLRKIQAAHKDQAAKALYRIAAIHHAAEQPEQRVAALRELVKEYPDSPEGEKAEDELGEMGVPPALPTEPLLDL